MKLAYSLVFFLCCLLSVSFRAAGAGCFGLELGETVDKYEHGQQAVHEAENLKMYEVRPGAPDADFDTYAVDAYDGKIIRIMASSPDDYSPKAENTLKVYKKLRSELTRLYGRPGFSFDDIDEANEDLLEYLFSNDGIEVLEWSFMDRQSDIGSIYVFLSGVEDEQGKLASYCTMYMESRDYASISDKIRQNEAPDPAEQGELPPEQVEDMSRDVVL